MSIRIILVFCFEQGVPTFLNTHSLELNLNYNFLQKMDSATLRKLLKAQNVGVVFHTLTMDHRFTVLQKVKIPTVNLLHLLAGACWNPAGRLFHQSWTTCHFVSSPNVKRNINRKCPGVSEGEYFET